MSLMIDSRADSIVSRHITKRLASKSPPPPPPSLSLFISSGVITSISLFLPSEVQKISLLVYCAESDNETAWDPPDRGTSFMFGLFSSEGTSSTYPTSRVETSDAPAGTCPHRHRWALPNFSWRVAVRCDVRRQRFASTAAIRREREERGCHSFCRETLRGRYGGPTRVPHGHRHRVLEQYVRGLLRWPWNSSRVYGTIQRHSRMDPSRARYRELLRLDTRRDLEFHSCTRTSAWKRYGVVPTRQERASGWSRYSGHRSATIGRQHQ